MVSSRCKGSRCLACINRVVTPSNCLQNMHPKIAEEWHKVKNGDLTPSGVTPGSCKSIWWQCKTCKHTYREVVRNKVHGWLCPSCGVRSNVSKISQIWLDSLNIPVEYRETRIKVQGKRIAVDAYDPNTNTVYEFFGRFWHGCPKTYDPDDIHPVIKVSFGELYKKTQQRVENIEMDGYNIVTKWEE